MSYCVNGFHVDFCHDRAPLVLVVMVALFIFFFTFLFTLFKSFQAFVFKFAVKF